MLLFIICVLISIICHELGHMISAILCGVKVKIFSLGIWEAYYFKGLERN